MIYAKKNYIVRGFIGGNYAGLGSEADNTLFNTYDMSRFPIFNAVVEKSINKTDTFRFTMGAQHKFINDVEPYRNWVLVIQYAGSLNSYYVDPKDWVPFCYDILFYGRVIEVETDLDGNKDVVCEGALGFFNDYILRHKDHRNSALSSYGILNSMCNLQNSIINASGAPERGDDPGNVDYRMMINNQFKRIYVNSSDVDDVDTSENDFADDTSVSTALELINSNLIEVAGGAVSAKYEVYGRPDYFYDIPREEGETVSYTPWVCSPIYTGAVIIEGVHTLLRYNKDSTTFGMGVGRGGIRPYDNYSPYSGGASSLTPIGSLSGNDQSSLVQFDYPRFILGENIINLDREPALDTIFTGVFPVGKDGMTLTDSPSSYTSKYIWASAQEKYGRIAISIDYPDVSSKTSLYNLANKWLKSHTSENLRKEFKYTVTGPEPVIMGRGSCFIRPLCGIAYSPNETTDAAHSNVYPCLSMTVDIFNPDNNQYSFGPFISENYSETSISTKTSKSKKKNRNNKK